MAVVAMAMMTAAVASASKPPVAAHEPDQTWLDPPLPGIEWGAWRTSPDTVIIYVSSSEGDDATGRLNSRSHPFRTLRAATLRAKNGAPDWIVLKSGDEFDDAWVVDRWRLSGRSADEPLVVAAYGLGPRPRIAGLRSLNGAQGPDRFMNHIVFHGIEFTEGVDIRTGGENIVFEDCAFTHSELIVQGFGPQPNEPALRGVTIKGCIFNNNYETSGRSQNFFANLIDGLTVEGCFFWRGGWSPDVQGAHASIYNHNVYIQYLCANVVFRGNITADASSHGAQVRPGGVVEGNLFLGNPIALTFGATSIRNYPQRSAAGVIRYNLVLDARDIDRSTPRGHGIWLDNAGPVEIHHNVIAHQRRGRSGNAFILGTAYHDVHLHDNIIYDWAGRTAMETSKAFLLSGTARGVNRIENNVVEILRGGVIVEDRTESPNWHFGPVESAVDFVDPKRDMDGYMESIGIEGGFDAFIERCLQQRRHDWDDRFTAEAVIRWVFAGFARQEGTGHEGQRIGD